MVVIETNRKWIVKGWNELLEFNINRKQDASFKLLQHKTLLIKTTENISKKSIHFYSAFRNFKALSLYLTVFSTPGIAIETFFNKKI